MTAVVGRRVRPFCSAMNWSPRSMKASASLCAQGEVEQATVERQRGVDVVDLQGDMVEADGARFPCLSHRILPLRSRTVAGTGPVTAVPVDRALPIPLK